MMGIEWDNEINNLDSGIAALPCGGAWIAEYVRSLCDEKCGMTEVYVRRINAQEISSEGNQTFRIEDSYCLFGSDAKVQT